MSSNTTPAISVIIPFFNGLEYIQEAIASALIETALPIEILVIDDGSSENIDQLKSKYGDNVRFFRKPNGGVASARNYGLKHASGKYIALLDQDDKFLKHKLRIQYQFMQQNPEAVAVHGNIQLIDHEGKNIVDGHLGHDPSTPPPSGSIFPDLYHGNFILACTAMFRRDAALSVGGFDETIWGADDYNFWMKLSNIGKIIYQNVVISEYRWHQNNASRDESKMDEARLIARLKILETANNISTPLSIAEMSAIIAKRTGQAAYKYYKNEGNPKWARRLLNIGLKAKPFDPLLLKMLIASYLPNSSWKKTPKT